MDLSVAVNRKQLAQTILQDIDNYCATTYDDGHRKHLGASQIGHVCNRYLFNTFRWIYHKPNSGRMHRLWNRGHKEEARFIEWLRGIGFEVWDIVPGTDKQQRISACMGHFGGSLDGQNLPPARYETNEKMLCEFKTSGTGAGFAKLKEQGVALAKPQHYVQMCNYGKHYLLRYALYGCINKNDDDIHIEIVPLDWSIAETSEKRANDVITARVPPEKFAFSEAVFECKYCDFVGQCHRGEAAEVNCRSCINSSAIAEGKWYCDYYQNTIPEDFIPKGCDKWKSII